jgi:ATP-dependent RNA helicase RhlE
LSHFEPTSQSALISSPIPSAQASELPGFAELGLEPRLLRAIAALGHQHPTPIQTRAIPVALSGADVLGIAQTGTGKTGAFALPILQRLGATRGERRSGAPRCLVLSPARELATQIARAFDDYGAFVGLRTAVIFGGVGMQPQIAALRAGIDVLVATPGRLVDLMSQRQVSFAALSVLVLDEADRMLDEGFLPAIRRIADTLPRARQTLFFSATMPPDIQHIADRMLVRPTRVEIAKVGTTADRVEQSVYFVEQTHKRALLRRVLDRPHVTRAVVFTRTKHGADRVVKQLAAASVEAAAIHGDKSQNQRERALSRFRDGSLRVLVATDLASRGIDVAGVSHVINYELPMDPEGYVHRVGRTARAGADGEAISFCSAEERPRLTSIERLIRRRIPVVEAPRDLALEAPVRPLAPAHAHSHPHPHAPRPAARPHDHRRAGRPRGATGA